VRELTLVSTSPLPCFHPGPLPLPLPLPLFLHPLFSGWKYSSREASKRKTLQKSDIQTAIAETDIFDFIAEIIGAPGRPPTQPSISGM
jgi:hypothetical protein